MEPVLLNTQLVFNGVAVGCSYGLVALGFVLIYKATEVVNFAQGELLMLGAFFAYTYIGILGLPYWLGALLAIASMAIFGGLLDRVVMRPVIGQPTFAYVMLTIGLGLHGHPGQEYVFDDLGNQCFSGSNCRNSAGAGQPDRHFDGIYRLESVSGRSIGRIRQHSRRPGRGCDHRRH